MRLYGIFDLLQVVTELTIFLCHGVMQVST
jgi:hypothetical protein